MAIVANVPVGESGYAVDRRDEGPGCRPKECACTLATMTGGETALLAASIAGGAAVVAALGATYGTYKVTDRSIKAQADRDREQRLVEACADLMWLVYCVMAKVEQQRPRFEFVDEPEDVPDISIAEETRIKARVQTLGSANVRNHLELWRAMLNGFRMPLGLLDEIAGGPGKPLPNVDRQEWAGLMLEMNDRREALRDIAAELEAAVRAELTDDKVLAQLEAGTVRP